MAQFEFRNQKNDTAEILLYGPIGADFWGEGITAKQFTKELKALGSVRAIDLHIDSPGGSVMESRAIYSQLNEHRATINVKIDGLAASAVTFIAMAGDSIAIAEGGFFMIHNAQGFVRGDAREMEKAAILLRSVNDSIIDTYVSRTKLPRQKIENWMNDETWFTGKDAVKNGFADTLMANKELTNLVTVWPENYRKVPKSLHPNAIKVARLKARVAAINERKW